MENNKISLALPPMHTQPSTTNALYYRSATDDKEYILLIQSENQRICKYDIQKDEYTHFNVPSAFKSVNTSHIITDENDDQLLTICTDKNQFDVFNLTKSKYILNYQQSNDQLNSKSHHHSAIPICMLVFCIFLCNSSVVMASIYAIATYFLSIHVSNYSHSFGEEIKCVIPHFDNLYNIQSCSVGTESLHFVANNHANAQTLNHFKFDISSRSFITLKPIDVSKQLEENEKLKTIRAYKLMHIQFMETLIMFTNTSSIWYYDFKDEEGWRIFEDVKLPKVPGNGWEINMVLGFGGIVFLFYYSDDDALTFCWDLLFTGNIFECDNKYVVNGECVAVNTDSNWTHFIGISPMPLHFKIALNEEIPVELSIVHLQYYHSLIKQYARTSIKQKLSTDTEMLILDYFPMFL